MNRALSIPAGEDTSDVTTVGDRCRLCGGLTKLKFQKIVRNRHQVCYSNCTVCDSLQTEDPYWLDDVYAERSSAMDTGMAHRSTLFAAYVTLLCRILNIGSADRCVDWGGGNGLFCRLMRDRGYNFLCYDKFVEPQYNIGFTTDEMGTADSRLITAFEVFEHLPNPMHDLLPLFSSGADTIICSTDLYKCQDESWSYLSADSGAHVFFYSLKALRLLGQRFGYDVIPGVTMHLFLKQHDPTRQISQPARKWIAHLLGKGFWGRRTPIIYDAWRARRAPKYYKADQLMISKTYTRRS